VAVVMQPSRIANVRLLLSAVQHLTWLTTTCELHGLNFSQTEFREVCLSVCLSVCGSDIHDGLSVAIAVGDCVIT
jgi:hypothetical protein